ncbi:anthranilate synthase component I, partial [Vibrio diabolicus]|nr:anthranilate synthase component I [Vibrio diabolicus]
MEIKNLTQLEVLNATLPYTQDPTALFHALCEGKTDCLLLESAEIDSKQNLKSLLLIDAAVRIICFGHQVTFQALSDNGRALIEVLAHNVVANIPATRSEDALTLTFTTPCDTLDEDSRLREASSFDALRLVQHSFDLSGHDKHA